MRSGRRFLLCSIGTARRPNLDIEKATDLGGGGGWGVQVHRREAKERAASAFARSDDRSRACSASAQSRDQTVPRPAGDSLPNEFDQRDR